MRFEHLIALFRPFRINKEELHVVIGRVNPFGANTGIDVQVKNAEALIVIIEAKAGVLLTHISMMIAVTGLMLASSEKALWYEALLAGELAAYLMLALLCIRCQNHFGANSLLNTHQKIQQLEKVARHHVYQKVVFGELLYREGLFRLVQVSLYILTFLLILTVLYGLLADEFGIFSAGEK